MAIGQAHTERFRAAVAACCLLLPAFPVVAQTAGTPDCQADAPLVFGILPFISVEQLVLRFSPLANYLSTRLRVPVHIETAPDFVEFARRTHEDRHYDILFTAPHFHSQARQKAGYRLIASVDSPGMSAVVVAPKDSDIHTIQDLKGKRLASVHPIGLATLLVREHLRAAGIDPDVDLVQVVTPSHDASLMSSYHGVTDAAALMQPPFEAASARVRESMRIIVRTRSTPHIPISIGPWISADCGAEITTLLLDMATTAEGQAVLQHNNFTGFRQADPDVYDELNEMLFR